MKRKICSCVAALALLAAAPAWAEPASAESVQKMMRVMKVESQYDSALGSTLQMMRDQMVNSIPKHANISAEQRAQIEAVIQNAWQKYQEQLTGDAELRKTVFASFQQLAQKYYTQQEVDALIGFYDSPLGQSILDKQGMMIGEFTQSVPAILDTRIQSMAREIMREMNAEIHRIVNQGRGRRGK
jgi:hypothetical protein